MKKLFWWCLDITFKPDMSLPRCLAHVAANYNKNVQLSRRGIISHPDLCSVWRVKVAELLLFPVHADMLQRTVHSLAAKVAQMEPRCQCFPSGLRQQGALQWPPPQFWPPGDQRYFGLFLRIKMVPIPWFSRIVLLGKYCCCIWCFSIFNTLTCCKFPLLPGKTTWPKHVLASGGFTINFH